MRNFLTFLLLVSVFVSRPLSAGEPALCITTFIGEGGKICYNAYYSGGRVVQVCKVTTDMIGPNTLQGGIAWLSEGGSGSIAATAEAGTCITIMGGIAVVIGSIECGLLLGDVLNGDPLGTCGGKIINEVMGVDGSGATGRPTPPIDSTTLFDGRVDGLIQACEEGNTDTLYTLWGELGENACRGVLEAIRRIEENGGTPCSVLANFGRSCREASEIQR